MSNYDRSAQPLRPEGVGARWSGITTGMTNQPVDLLALRSDERAALLLVGLRGDF